MSTARSILSADPLPQRGFGPHLVTRDTPPGADLDPFLMVSLYSMRGATFPPHPHAGFMVATYILPESEIGFVNQDSLGTRNRIAPGALHVTVAGRGVLHEEQPEVEGTLAQGFQIWIDLPDNLRDTAPHALHLATGDVPVLSAPGVAVRVVLGAAGGLRSPLGLPTAATLLDVTLAPGASWAASLPTGDHAFAFVLGGTLDAGGRPARAGDLLRTAPDGDTLTLTAGPQGARLSLFAGTPLHHPRWMQGPFVARDAQQLERFVRDHAEGRFGTLRPLVLG